MSQQLGIFHTTITCIRFRYSNMDEQALEGSYCSSARHGTLYGRPMAGEYYSHVIVDAKAHVSGF